MSEEPRIIGLDTIPQFSDRPIVCLDCNSPFTWTASEQEYYWNKHLLPPKRCASCRQARKAALPKDPPKW